MVVGIRLTAMVGLAGPILILAALVATSCSDEVGGNDEGRDGTRSMLAEEATGGRPARPDDPTGGAPAQRGTEEDAGSGDGEGETDGAKRGPAPPGTLVWVVGTEPPDLHLDDPANGLEVTAWIREGMLESLFGVGPDRSYHPELLAAEPTVTADEDTSVVIRYRLRSDLQWSDGTPLTAEDVAYTHRILTEGCEVEADGSILDSAPGGCVYRTASRIGLDQVTAFEVVSDTEFTVTMASFYPDWRRLYAPVLAAHAFGEDATQVNQRLRTMAGLGGPLPSSGPLRFESWESGRSITLVRNESYHGSTAPGIATAGPAEIETVRIDFEPDPEARVADLVGGRADLLLERAGPTHRALAEADGVEVDSVAGADYEHWGLNLLNPHLSQPAIREAVAHAIDKPAMIETVFGPLLGSAEEPAALGNTYWLTDQAAYIDNQEPYGGAQVDEARLAIESAGYETGPDGVYRHPTLGRLELRVATTGGDPVREATQEALAAQLAEAGIEVTIDNPPGGLFFQQGPFAPDAMAASASAGQEGDPTLWDIAQFGWAGGPWPGGQSGAYRSGSPGNPYGFSNAEFEVAAFECDAVVDDGERAACYNDLDRFVSTLDHGEDGLFMIPLAQRPLVLAWSSERVEARPEVSDGPLAGPLASIVDYRLAGD